MQNGAPDVFHSWTTKIWLSCVVVLCYVPMALAVDVRLQASESFVNRLRAASLTVETAAQNNPVAQDILSAARADYQRLLSSLYELGYYGGVISIRVDGREAADISPFGGPEAIERVDILIDPGPRFRFSTARVAPLAPTTELPEGFAPGQPALSDRVVEAAQAGVDAWRDAGHAKANVSDQRITANHARAELAADIRLAPGPRLTFGDLLVAEPGRVRPSRVRAIAGLPTGEVFSPEDLKRSSERLRRTGAFRSVVLTEADTPGPGNTLDITAELVDAKPRRFGVGAEIASLEGLSLNAFWMHRNLLGGAERLRFEGEVRGIGGDTDGIDYRVGVRFDRPATITPDTSLVLGFEIEEQDEPGFRESSAQAGIGLSHIFNDELTGQVGIAYRFSDIDDDAGSRTLEHVLFPVSLTYDSRDDPLDAHSGIFIDTKVTPFAAVGSGGSGARFFADARTYLGFGEKDRHVAAFRAQIGSVVGAGLTEVSPDMLFFSGGSDTVRGQPFESLAVDIGGGNRLGGRSFLAISSELRYGLNDTWSVVAFADAGFVGSDSFISDSGEVHAGAGFGVRYDTGIGPIRLDIATPVDSDAGQQFEFYIGIGQAF
ncbi:autotransporter assembly complex protein TamA [Roseovarius rhodophyticola]|uniref:Autotransporter assembly complex family protein n=1 Tax=Roseovarius rhodophyticola TaxID=3080827 RepID=A0ABZ2TJL9_9RHOB|nr:autotransporter assembly complex family protein [Roseovarius sp. W115]MDV2928886.1 autotransporter assembly complex family protein [Roseovarius sp. W115]